MEDSAARDELLAHLEGITRLTRSEIGKVLSEALAFYAESVEEFVARRHGELQTSGLKNEVIFPQIGEEMRARRFAAPPLSERQLRRLVYG